MDSDNEMTLRVRRKVAKQLYDALSPDSCPENDETKERTKSKPESAYSIQNVLWLIVSMGVFYISDFARAIIYDHRIKRGWFNAGLVLLGIHLTIACFLIVYLSWIKKLSSDDWDRHYPAAIPIATASFAFGSFCITIGLWPVWSVLTIPILFTQFMGIIVLIAMLPAF